MGLFRESSQMMNGKVEVRFVRFNQRVGKIEQGIEIGTHSEAQVSVAVNAC